MIRALITAFGDLPGVFAREFAELASLLEPDFRYANGAAEGRAVLWVCRGLQPASTDSLSDVVHCLIEVAVATSFQSFVEEIRYELPYVIV